MLGHQFIVPSVLMSLWITLFKACVRLQSFQYFFGPTL